MQVDGKRSKELLVAVATGLDVQGICSGHLQWPPVPATFSFPRTGTDTGVAMCHELSCQELVTPQRNSGAVVQIKKHAQAVRVHHHLLCQMPLNDVVLSCLIYIPDTGPYGGSVVSQTARWHVHINVMAAASL